MGLIPQDDIEKRANPLHAPALTWPAVAMAGLGWTCLLPAAMMDSPHFREPWINIFACCMALTCPLGLVSWGTSYWLAKRYGRRWLWLNWWVFAAYGGTLVVSGGLGGVRL